MPSSILRPILLATLVAGTLDILAAIGLTLYYGREPADMLRYVASGPVPAGDRLGRERRRARPRRPFRDHGGDGGRLSSPRPSACPRCAGSPVAWGVAYGLATYVVMNLIVVPLALRRRRCRRAPRAIVTQLFCHFVLVGLPIALIAARHFRRRARSPAEMTAPAIRARRWRRKLSLKDGLRTWWEDMPDAVRDEIEREGLASPSPRARSADRGRPYLRHAARRHGGRGSRASARCSPRPASSG